MLLLGGELAQLLTLGCELAIGGECVHLASFDLSELLGGSWGGGGGEEIGLLGARHVTLGKLGKPKLCFNWDGGAPGMAVIGATGDDHLDIEVHGLASHAGAHPEDGVSAIAIAGKAIADLQENGWHGLIIKGRNAGTSNIGIINGGDATNP